MTVEAPEAPPQVAETAPVTFRSIDLNYRIVLTADWDEPTNFGVKQHAGKHVQFNFGSFSTDDLELIQLLRENEQCRTSEAPAGWFWEVGNEPGRAKPEAEDRLAVITAAAIKGDAETVKAELRAEFATHSRDVVTKPAIEALKQLALAGVEGADEEVRAAETPETSEGAPADVFTGPGPAPAPPVTAEDIKAAAAAEAAAPETADDKADTAEPDRASIPPEGTPPEEPS